MRWLGALALMVAAAALFYGLQGTLGPPAGKDAVWVVGYWVGVVLWVAGFVALAYGGVRAGVWASRKR